MNLYTRCPQCETVFRVTTRELQASSGRVRCGHCQRVFDAFATLTAQEPASASGNTEPPIVKIDPRSAVTQDKALPATSQPPASRPVAASAHRDDPAATLYEWEFRVPPPRTRTGLWVLLSLLAALGAAVEGAYAFRDDVLASFPQVKPVYERTCTWLGCRFGLPRLSERLNIDASDLQAIDPAHPNQIELSVIVRNRAATAVDYPAFELTLTNSQDQVLARRVFTPAEYLGDAAAVGAGLGAHAELPIRLYLDTGKIAAAGYRVYFFYP